MQIRDVFNCCGAKLIYDFGYSCNNAEEGNRSTCYRPSEQEVSDYLNDKKRIYNNKILVAYLDDEQVKNIGKAIIKAEFKKIISVYHSNHDSIITQYIWAKDNNIRSLRGGRYKSKVKTKAKK